MGVVFNYSGQLVTKVADVTGVLSFAMIDNDIYFIVSDGSTFSLQCLKNGQVTTVVSDMG